MEQSPSWEANWFSASQEISHILWNPKVHYHIYKSLDINYKEKLTWVLLTILKLHKLLNASVIYNSIPFWN